MARSHNKGTARVSLFSGSASRAKRRRPKPDTRLDSRIWASLPGAHFEALEPRVLMSSGDLDPTFGGGDGIVTTSATSGADWISDVALAADGRIVVVGSAGG